MLLSSLAGAGRHACRGKDTYSRASASERASESTRFCFVNVNERGVHNYRGNGGANPVYRSQSKHAGTILRFRSSRFGAVASGAMPKPARSFRDVLPYFETRVSSISSLPPLDKSKPRRSIFGTRTEFERRPPNNERRRRSPLETGVKLNLNKLIGAGSGKRALFFLSLTRSLRLFSRAHPTFLQLSRPDSARGGYAHFRLMN